MSRKGHISGYKIKGTHTTVLEGVEDVVAKLIHEPLLLSVRAGAIDQAGGTPSLTIKRHNDAHYANTLTLIFHRTGAAQKIYFEVDNLDANLPYIVGKIKAAAQKEFPGMPIRDVTAQPYTKITDASATALPDRGLAGLMQLRKWEKSQSASRRK
jgi:hypothetical protein